MRKDELVKALVKTETKGGKAASKPASSAKSASTKKATPAKRGASAVPAPKGNVAKVAAKKAAAKGASKAKEPAKSSARTAAKSSTSKPAAKSAATKVSRTKAASSAAKSRSAGPKTAAVEAQKPATKAKPTKAAAAKAAAPKPAAAKSSAPAKSPAAAKPAAAKASAKSSTVKIAKSPKPAPPKSKTNPRVIRKIQEAHERMDRRRDLAGDSNGSSSRHTKDRCALLVRDPYWLQAYWEISRETVERAKVALAAQWHTVQPMLRLAEIDDAGTTSTAERIVREIPVHGGVCNWYIDVVEPPKTYRVTLGYKASTGKFHTLARSNKVTTPTPGASDMMDGNWLDIAEDCEKFYAMSGGYAPENSDQQLRELFEDRLRRPMGSPSVTQYGAGADVSLGRLREFQFSVDAEMIVFGQTDATAYVTLGGEPIKLRGDGTFSVRLPLPDRRQVLPIVASSADGVEQRTTVLAVERNTKVMEPLIRENGDD